MYHFLACKYLARVNGVIIVVLCDDREAAPKNLYRPTSSMYYVRRMLLYRGLCNCECLNGLMSLRSAVY